MSLYFSSIQGYFKTLGTLLTRSIIFILASKEIRQELTNICKGL